MSRHERPKPPETPKREQKPGTTSETGTARATPAGNLVSVQLLAELVNTPLDAGYAAAAKRRGGKPSRRWYDQSLVALGALLAGFVLVVAYVHTNRGAPEADRVHDRLVERVRSAQDDADSLSRDLAGAERQLENEQDRALPSSGALARDLQRARTAAGDVPVSGPGFTVTLGEPKRSAKSSQPGRAGSVPITATHILSDRDVRSVVNELWRDGAEAIAVNGIRLTPTSAIRFAGEAVLVDFQPITSPYRIEAIGDPDTLATEFAQSEPASRYQTRKGADGITFRFSDESRLELPASSLSSPRYATPVPSASKRGSR